MNDEEALDRYYWKAHDLLNSGKPSEALNCLLLALAICKESVETLLQAGEIHLYYGADMGLSSDISSEQALSYFDQVLIIESRHAGAWTGKAFAEFYLDRPKQALASINKGFDCLQSGIGYGMGFEPVKTNLLESLFRCKVLALLELGRREEARRTLGKGLEAVPSSRYLTCLVDEFQPQLEAD